MKSTYRFPVVVEKDKDGYFASCPTLPGCYTQGATYEEVLKNIHEAIELHLEDMAAEREQVRDPEDIILSSVEVAKRR